MAMRRSALAGIPRRLLATAATPSVMCRRGTTEIMQAQSLPFLHPAAPLIPRPGSAAQMMRTFTFPAATPAASAVRIRGVSNLPGQEPVVPKGTLSMDQIGKKGAELIASVKHKAGRLLAWNSSDLRFESMAIAVVSVASFVSSALTYHDLMRNDESPGKSVSTDSDGKMMEGEGLLPVL